MKKNVVFTILTLLLLSIICVMVITLIKSLSKPTNDSKKNIKSLNFDALEIAKTQSQMEKGLMNRESLCSACAMLFIFENSQILDFWMKNTLIPLDMIFVDEQNYVVNIYQNTTPLQTFPTYSSKSKAKYVIETNAYYTKYNDIKIGDTIDIAKLIDSWSK
jgi:uncharacterized membrane protein (UPF0127 family)